MARIICWYVYYHHWCFNVPLFGRQKLYQCKFVDIIQMFWAVFAVDLKVIHANEHEE